MNQPSAAAVAQTTPAGHAIARVVAQHYDLDGITECALFRRGFNHVYGLRFADGSQRVARLSADRPRGAPNVEYEAALLAHLQRAGVSVAASLPTRDGAAAATMQLPEGERVLMLFEHLAGEAPGDSLRDVEATGRALALLHEAGESFRGPDSLYALELPQLLWASLRHLGGAPTMDDALREAYTAIARRLEARIADLPALTRVVCHGDCHGSNNFMNDRPDGTRVASFFDFDDAGPGCLAYELCVYLWAMLPRKVGGALDASELERWRAYLAGYRSVRAIAQSDIDAIAAFVAVRQFWLLGEYAGRVAVWGTQTLPTSWLRKHVDVLAFWETMRTPA